MLFPNFITIFATSTDVYDAAFASHYYTKVIETSDKTTPKRTQNKQQPYEKENSINSYLHILHSIVLCRRASTGTDVRI